MIKASFTTGTLTYWVLVPELDSTYTITDSVANWTKVANENSSYNVGADPVMCRYGADTRWAYGWKTGNVNFNNSTWGDPASGTSKQGQAVLSCTITIDPVPTDPYTIQILQNEPIFVTTETRGNGTATGDGTYSQGDSVTLTATPGYGYVFNKWEINGTISYTNPYTFTASEDTNGIAFFDEMYEIDVSYDASVGSASYEWTSATQITLTATPNQHSTFDGWYINDVLVSSSNPYVYTPTGDVTIEARFIEDEKFFVSVSSTIENSSVYVSSEYAYVGDSVTIFARPYPAYNFVRWDDGNTDNPRTITVTANVTLVAIYLKEIESNSIYSYRCYIKDQMAMTDPPKAFLRVDSFNIKTDLMTNATSTINVIDSASNINNGDVLVLYDPKGMNLYQGVIKSMEDGKITCSQMQSFYKGTWIYNVYPSSSLEEEIAYLLGQYAQGKMYRSSYTDPLVAQRLGGITIDYTASTSANLPTDLDSDGNENLTEMDMEKWIYDLYEDYNIVFDFEINYSGTNYVHIKVPSYSSVKVGNNMYAIKDMKPTTSIEETNRLIIFAQDKTYRTTYVATATSIVEEPSSTANRFDLTNTKIVYSDDPVADLIAANLPDQMYNHKLEFTLVVKNFIYQFGDFNLGGQLDIYYFDQYYNSVLTGYEIAKASNMNITDVKMVCGKVRSKLTQKLTLGRVQ